MFQDLLAADGVAEELVLRGRIGVMALHGGLEAGTADAARRTAALGSASLYAVVQPADFRWHVPSTKFDPRHSEKLTSFLEHVSVAVSIHGFGRRGLEHTVLVGGTNQRLRGIVAAGIERRTGLRAVTEESGIPSGLSGRHPRNPVNLPPMGGVQIELSPQAREGAVFDDLVGAIGAVVAAEQRSLCAS